MMMRFAVFGAACYVAGSVGFYVQNYEELTREPCIRSYYSLDFGWMDRLEQEWIDKATPYPEDSEFVTELGIKDSREWVFYLYEQGEGIANDIHVDNFGREYVIPYKCYVGEVNYWNEPIMYRRK